MTNFRIMGDEQNLPDPLSDAELCAWLACEVWEWRELRAAGQAPLPILILRDSDDHEVDALTSRAAVQWWIEEQPTVSLLDVIDPAELPDDGETDDPGDQEGGAA